MRLAHGPSRAPAPTIRNRRCVFIDDQEIIRLYQTRSEGAIAASEQQYGAYCLAIAQRVLGSKEDARECVNDLWLKAWARIPDDPPQSLQAYFAKLTRELAIDRYRRSHSQKRGAGQFTLAYEELSECIPSGHSVERTLAQKELARTLRDFLKTLPPIQANIFLCRYWYFDAIPEIAERFGFTRSKVTSLLHRTRKRLKSYLQEAGYSDEDL